VGGLELADLDSLSTIVQPDRVTALATPGRSADKTGEVEARVGHRFLRRARLREALTHSSAAGRGQRRKRSNERLEFLGDRVLDLVIAEVLFGRFPHEGEGALSQRQAGLVRRETLAEIAAELGVGDWLILARGEEEGGGRTNPAILADTLEALIGALYLDGGWTVAEAFIGAHWEPRLARMQGPPRDAKTALQEWTQSRGLGLPVYQVTKTSGPPHAPTFEIAASLADVEQVTATGSSKRAAEQAAAERLLARLAGQAEAP
jgi:ribonuclease III